MSAEVPAIDVGPLFQAPSARRDAADRLIMQAASGIGFMTITNFPGSELLTPDARAKLLAVFTLPKERKAELLRWNFDNSKSSLYRGWFPLQAGAASYKEGIDMGPDVAYPDREPEAGDPLCEATPLPDPKHLPEWREAIAAYYRAMEIVGRAVMRSVARGLGLSETIFDSHFENGISTLRLIRYPPREVSISQADATEHTVLYNGMTRDIIGRQHIDSGLVTLLAQDGVEGLQARNHSGDWFDVPALDGTLAVNFGQLLERWSAGKVRATLHRVIAPGRTRFSIPFFYEPGVDAEIAPLPILGAEPFEPFLYGDYLWEAATKFIEMSGVRHLRQPRGLRR